MTLPTPQPTTPPQADDAALPRQTVIAGDKLLRAQLIAALQVVEDRLEAMGEPPTRRYTLPAKDRAA